MSPRSVETFPDRHRGRETQEDRMDGMSLLDVLRGVMLDPAEQAAYNADPAAYLGQYGYEDVDQADLSEAFGLVADTLPPDQAQAAWQAASTPEGDAFGTVTADFDSDTGVDGPEAFEDGSPAGGGPALFEEPEIETTLSFGQGEAADGPPASSAAVLDPDEGSPGDGGGDLPADEDAGAPGAEGGDDLDVAGPDDGDLDDADDLDGGFGPDDGTDGGLDEGYADGGLDDDFGDLDRIDGLDDLSFPNPDDTDIGSF
jgi:hypothetical protein